MIHSLRPDRLTAMARIFVEKVLGSEFVHVTAKELNLATICENEVKNLPVLYSTNHLPLRIEYRELF